MEGNDILIACTIGDLAWLKRSLVARSGTLITAGSLRNSEGLGPVHLAAKNCKANVLEYLLTDCAMEADTQAQPSGDTALHCALSRAAYRTAAADNTRCVKMLINKGANCNRQNNNGCTPLHCAAKGGYATVLKMLLSHGANIHIKDNAGKTAYDLACLHGHYKCARLLQALLWADTKDRVKEHEFHMQSREQSLRSQQVKECSMERCCTPLEPMTEPPSGHPVSHPTTSSVTGHHKATGSRQLLHVAKTKISLHQAERNFTQVGKPDKMYPYTNYPPVKLRQHSSLVHQSNSLPTSSQMGPGVKLRLVQSARSSSSSSRRPHSSQSLKSKSLSSTYYSHGKRAPRHGRSIPAKDIHSRNESPNSPSDANHCSQSHHAQPGISMNVINLESVDLLPGNRSNDVPPNESGSEESDNGGSTSSIDGLMFHDVGQVNDLQSLAIPQPSSCAPPITPAELLQILRLANTCETRKKPVRRASSYCQRANKGRPDVNRRFSLGAIPEGEIVTHYPDEQAEGSLDFDEEFLYAIMPFAFKGLGSTAVEDIHQSHTDLTKAGLPFTSPPVSQQPASSASKKDIPSSQTSRSEATQYSKNVSSGPLSIVTVAWESESTADTADDRPISPRTGQPRLPLSPTGLEPVAKSPPPSPSHIARTPVSGSATLAGFCGKEPTSSSEEISSPRKGSLQANHYLGARHHLLQKRAKSAPQKRTVPQQQKQILKSTLYEFGCGLKHY